LPGIRLVGERDRVFEVEEDHVGWNVACLFDEAFADARDGHHRPDDGQLCHEGPPFFKRLREWLWRHYHGSLEGGHIPAAGSIAPARFTPSLRLSGRTLVRSQAGRQILTSVGPTTRFRPPRATDRFR